MNVASNDNYMLINSYLAFCVLLFSMTTLLQLGVYHTTDFNILCEVESPRPIFAGNVLKNDAKN